MAVERPQILPLNGQDPSLSCAPYAAWDFASSQTGFTFSAER